MTQRRVLPVQVCPGSPPRCLKGTGSTHSVTPMDGPLPCMGDERTQYMAARAAATTSFNAGRFDEARERFTTLIALAKCPLEHIAALNNRSSAHLKLGLNESAVSDAATAVTLCKLHASPTLTVKAHYRHACALLAYERPCEALLAVEEALREAEEPPPCQLTELRARCRIALSRIPVSTDARVPSSTSAAVASSSAIFDDEDISEHGHRAVEETLRAECVASTTPSKMRAMSRRPPQGQMRVMSRRLPSSLSTERQNEPAPVRASPGVPLTAPGVPIAAPGVPIAAQPPSELHAASQCASAPVGWRSSFGNLGEFLASTPNRRRSWLVWPIGALTAWWRAMRSWPSLLGQSREIEGDRTSWPSLLRSWWRPDSRRQTRDGTGGAQDGAQDPAGSAVSSTPVAAPANGGAPPPFRPPFTPPFGRLAADELYACLEPLGLLDLVTAKCVSHACAQAARRVLSARSEARLLPGTYVVSTRRRAVHPDAMWDEDTVYIEGEGTMTLHESRVGGWAGGQPDESGLLIGQLEERVCTGVGAPSTAPAAVARGVRSRDDSGVEEQLLGDWRPDGRLRLALGLRLRPPQRRGLGFMLTLQQADVSATSQIWRFTGSGAGYLAARAPTEVYYSWRGGQKLVHASTLSEADEEGGEVILECRLLYS